MLLVDLGSLLGQGTKTFTGKITEIAKGTELDIAKHGKFFVLRLDESPNIEFRLSRQDAEKYGVIAAGGEASILTPKMMKGLGWKVQLTCDAQPTGPLKNPVYKVLMLKRLDGN